MSYVRPLYNSADASWEGSAEYNRPAYDSADATFQSGLALSEANPSQPQWVAPALELSIAAPGQPQEVFSSTGVELDVHTANPALPQWVSPALDLSVASPSQPQWVTAPLDISIAAPGEPQSVVAGVALSLSVAAPSIQLPVRPGYPVQATHSAPYTMPVAGVHSAPWRFVVQATHRAPYYITAPVMASHAAVYDIAAYNTVEGSADLAAGFAVEGSATLHSELLAPVAATHRAPYDLEQYNTVEGSTDLAAGFAVEGDTEVAYSLLQPVQATHRARYDILQYTQVEGSTDLAAGFGVEGATEIACNLRDEVEGYTEIGAGLLHTVEGSLELMADMPALNTVQGSTMLIYNLLDESPLISTGTVTLTHRGQPVRIGSQATLEIAEGEPWWKATVGVSADTDMSQLDHGEPLVLSWYGEVFNLVVASYQTDRQHNSTRKTLKLVSPPAFLAQAPAVRISKTWEAPTSARAVVEEMLGPVEWRVLDWVIPANRLGGEDAYPLDIAQRVVEAIGGVIECYPNGALYVRYRHEVPVADYATEVPAHVFSEAENLFSVSDQNQYADIADSFRIMDTDAASFADRLEFVVSEDSGLAGELHVYPSPWRDNVRLVHTGPAAVRLSGGGTELLEKTEQIEIVAGKGNLSYPIHSITSVSWEVVDLGGLSPAEAGSNAVVSTVTGESLVTVTYLAKAKVYATSSPVVDEVQFVLYED